MIVGISGYVGSHLTGIGRVLIEVLNEIAPLHRETEYILFKNYDFKDYSILENHANIKIVNINVSKNSPLKNILWHQWSFQKLQAFYKCDIAYIPNFSLLLWKRIPTVVTIHDLIEYNVPDKFGWFRMIYRKIIDPLMTRNSTFITTVSACSKRDIVRFCHVDEEKIIVIPNAVDRSKFKKNNEIDIENCLLKYNLVYKGYFLFVGTIDYPGKNIMSALTVFFNLKEKYGIVEKMVIVGKRGYNSDVIYKYVNDSVFGRDVVFTGYVPDSDLPFLYGGARVMIYLSYYEGFGLPVLEAMSCGVPVVCSNTSCFPEIIGDMCVGVSPSSIPDIEKLLFRLVVDAAFYSKIESWAYERASAFSWKKSALSYYLIFEKYAKKRN